MRVHGGPSQWRRAMVAGVAIVSAGCSSSSSPSTEASSAEPPPSCTNAQIVPVENLWWTVSGASTVAVVTPLEDGSAEAFVVDACGAQIGERLTVAEGADLYPRFDRLFSTGLFAYDGFTDIGADEIVVRALDPVTGQVRTMASYPSVDEVGHPLGGELNMRGFESIIERFDDSSIFREVDQHPVGMLQRQSVTAQLVGSERLAVVSAGGLAMVSTKDLTDIWSLPSSNAFTDIALLDTVLLAASDAKLTGLAVEDGRVLFSITWADLGLKLVSLGMTRAPECRESSFCGIENSDNLQTVVEVGGHVLLSNDGRTVAIDLTTGAMAWEAEGAAIPPTRVSPSRFDLAQVPLPGEIWALAEGNSNSNDAGITAIRVTTGEELGSFPAGDEGARCGRAGLTVRGERFLCLGRIADPTSATGEVRALLVVDAATTIVLEEIPLPDLDESSSCVVKSFPAHVVVQCQWDTTSVVIPVALITKA